MLSNGQIVLEQEILGSLFKNEDLIIKAKEKIKPEMFLYSKHMNIYLGILEMVENKMKEELITPASGKMKWKPCIKLLLPPNGRRILHVV